MLCEYWSGCVLEWLHQGCDSDLPADFYNFGAGDFPFKIYLKKRFKIFFLLWHRDRVLELQFLTPLREVLLCFAAQSLCKSHCSGCVKVAWSRSCVRNTILFCSWTVAGHRKSSWSGCIKAAIVTCQQIFSTLALVIFLVKFFLSFEKCFKIVFCFGVEIAVLELQFLTPLRVVLLGFATQSLQIE